MADPCADDSGSVPSRCARGNLVEIELSGFPEGWTDDYTHAPPGFTMLAYALTVAFDSHPPELSVPMPGGWFEEVTVGSGTVEPKPTDDGSAPNPRVRWIVPCSVYGVAPAMGYPRPASELAVLWAGSLTTVPLPDGASCTSTVVGPYTRPDPPPHVPGGGSTG